MTLQQLLNNNNIKDSNKISIGQKINLTGSHLPLISQRPKEVNKSYTNIQSTENKFYPTFNFRTPFGNKKIETKFDNKK